jgi:hypothetical protein
MGSQIDYPVMGTQTLHGLRQEIRNSVNESWLPRLMARMRLWSESAIAIKFLARPPASESVFRSTDLEISP